MCSKSLRHGSPLLSPSVLTSKYAPDARKRDRPTGGFAPVLRVDFQARERQEKRSRKKDCIGPVGEQSLRFFKATHVARVCSPAGKLPTTTRPFQRRSRRLPVGDLQGVWAGGWCVLSSRLPGSRKI